MAVYGEIALSDPLGDGGQDGLAPEMCRERVEDVLAHYERLRLKRVGHIVQRSAEGR
ncbi:hypothetical protein [Notoacmeibacter marinus]|uniref:hypothetical protein n=1 Tax=Notoacmeibacter marinus TaxID=1876515 RepID=UPI0013036520|nr:hypothetical protein [Notoacmeibacter marinus]